MAYLGLEQAEKVAELAPAACEPALPPCRRQLKSAAPSALKKNSAAGAAVIAVGPAVMIACGPATLTWTCARCKGVRRRARETHAL